MILVCDLTDQFGGIGLVVKGINPLIDRQIHIRVIQVDNRFCVACLCRGEHRGGKQDYYHNHHQRQYSLYHNSPGPPNYFSHNIYSRSMRTRTPAEREDPHLNRPTILINEDIFPRYRPIPTDDSEKNAGQNSCSFTRNLYLYSQNTPS